MEIQLRDDSTLSSLGLLTGTWVIQRQSQHKEVQLATYGKLYSSRVPHDP